MIYLKFYKNKEFLNFLNFLKLPRFLCTSLGFVLLNFSLCGDLGMQDEILFPVGHPLLPLPVNVQLCIEQGSAENVVVHPGLDQFQHLRAVGLQLRVGLSAGLYIFDGDQFPFSKIYPTSFKVQLYVIFCGLS